MNQNRLIRNYYVLPCCVLLLNLCIGIVGYKAKIIVDPLLRTLFIMAMVLFGGSLIELALAPGINWLVARLHQGTRRQAGRLGEILFLVVLGLAVFWLYFRMYILGPQSIVPPPWRNH